MEIQRNCTFHYFQKREKKILLINKSSKTNFIHKKFTFASNLAKRTKNIKKHGHQQTIALFTIFQNIGNTNHFSNISTLTSIAK